MALCHVHVAKLELSFPGVPSWIVPGEGWPQENFLQDLEGWSEVAAGPLKDRAGSRAWWQDIPLDTLICWLTLACRTAPRPTAPQFLLHHLLQLLQVPGWVYAQLCGKGLQLLLQVSRVNELGDSGQKSSTSQSAFLSNCWLHQLTETSGLTPDAEVTEVHGFLHQLPDWTRSIPYPEFL